MGAGGIPPNNTTRDLAQVYQPAIRCSMVMAEQSPRLASEFARLTYQFNDKYMITGTVRRDGSSKFANGQ